MDKFFSPVMFLGGTLGQLLEVKRIRLKVFLYKLLVTIRYLVVLKVVLVYMRYEISWYWIFIIFWSLHFWFFFFSTKEWINWSKSSPFFLRIKLICLKKNSFDLLDLLNQPDFKLWFSINFSLNFGVFFGIFLLCVNLNMFPFLLLFMKDRSNSYFSL